MRLLIVTILCTSFFSANAQKQELSFGKLLNNNEEVIFGFRLARGKKMAVVCKEKSGKYLAYRFGTADSVELSYPATLDKSSGKLFSYYGYHRGGGKQNAAMDLYSLTFTHNGVKYHVYDEWYSEDDSRGIGIQVTTGKKTVDLKGDLKARVKTLGLLETEDELIHNIAWD